MKSLYFSNGHYEVTENRQLLKVAIIEQEQSTLIGETFLGQMPAEILHALPGASSVAESVGRTSPDGNNVKTDRGV